MKIESNLCCEDSLGMPKNNPCYILFYCKYIIMIDDEDFFVMKMSMSIYVSCFTDTVYKMYLLCINSYTIIISCGNGLISQWRMATIASFLNPSFRRIKILFKSFLQKKTSKETQSSLIFYSRFSEINMSKNIKKRKVTNFTCHVCLAHKAS